MKLPVSNTVLTLIIGAIYVAIINQGTLALKERVDNLEVKGAAQAPEAQVGTRHTQAQGTPLVAVASSATKQTVEDGVVDLDKLFAKPVEEVKVVEIENPKPLPPPNYLRMLAAGLSVTAIGDKGAVINGTYYTLNEPMEDVQTSDGKHPILKSVTLEGAEIAIDGKSAPVRWLILDETI